MGSLSHPSHQGQDRSPPPQGEQPIPSSLQGQHRRKGRIQFSTALSVKHTPLPQAPSDSLLAHIWDRNSVPALGSTEKLRKARARPTQTHSALAPTPCPYPALLRWFFLGIKLTLGQMFPCRSECGGKRGMPHYTHPSISLHWLFPELHVIPSDPKEDFVRPRTQLHSSHKETGYQDTGINTANQQWLSWPTCQIKAATALLKSQPLFHGNPPRGINSLTFSPTKKPFKSRRSSSSVGNLSTVTHL